MRRFVIVSMMAVCLLIAAGARANAGDVQIRYGRCTVKKITDEAKKEIEGQKNYQDLRIVFDKAAANEDFATITKLPWVKNLTISGSQITDIAPVSKLKALQAFHAGSLKKIDKKNRLDVSPLGSCTELVQLNLYATEITGQNALAKCTKMKDLKFYMSDVDDISCVASMPELEKLDLYACKRIRSYQPMKGLKHLKHLNLYMHDTPRSEFDVLLTLPALETIWLHFTEIEDLDFMANATNMKSIDASWCRQLKDISAVANLKKLEELELDDAPVSDISPVQGLKELEELEISDTKITDLSALKDLPKLEDLDVSETSVKDLTPLKGLTALEELDLGKTAVTDLSPLTALPKLQELDLTESAVTDISPLKDMRSLRDLDLRKTGVTDISGLKGLPELRKLDLRETKISDLSPLKGQTKLYSLYLDRSAVTDLSPLKDLEALRYVRLSETKVKDISPLFELKNLRSLAVPTTVPAEQVEEFKKKLPKCRVRVDKK